jgi:hypothetical protein
MVPGQFAMMLQPPRFPDDIFVSRCCSACASVMRGLEAALLASPGGWQPHCIPTPQQIPFLEYDGIETSLTGLQQFAMNETDSQGDCNITLGILTTQDTA